MTTNPIPIIELNQTDPKKRGQVYGEAARKRIHTILDKYHEIFQCITGETWETTVERGESFISKAQAFAPDLVEEIRGVAEGADRSFMDIFLLNARSEILFNPRVLAQECTTVAALPECTNFLIGYADGDAVNLETSPVEEHVLWPQNEFFVHTNHYLKQGKNFRDLKPLRDPYLSTYLRCRRAQKGMAALNGSIDVKGILKILSDHMDIEIFFTILGKLFHI